MAKSENVGFGAIAGALPHTIINYRPCGASSPPGRSHMTAAATRYLDHYRLIRRIDTGAMLDTYEAELLGWDDYTRRLALKTLQPRFEREPAVWQRFVEGATRASSLRHPNMVGVYDVGFDGGAHYLAVDLVEGQSLRELLDRCRELGQRFPTSASAYVLRELAATLHDLHCRQPGLGHGDVTPQNVYITPEGGVKLGDLSASAAALSLLRHDPSAVRDRLPYYAPELLAGTAASSRTDVFALGLILFELLTGCPLNAGDSEQDMLRHAANPPQLLPSHVVDGVAPLDHIVRGALQRDPTMRTASADRVRAQLAEYLGRDLFNHVSMVGLLHTLFRSTGQSGSGPHSGTSGANSPTPGSPIARTSSARTPSLLTRDVTHRHAATDASLEETATPVTPVAPMPQPAESNALSAADAYARATSAEAEEVLELDPEDLISEQIFIPGRRLVRGMMWFVGCTGLVAGVLAVLLMLRDNAPQSAPLAEGTSTTRTSPLAAEAPAQPVMLSPTVLGEPHPAPVVEVQVAAEADEVGPQEAIAVSDPAGRNAGPEGSLGESPSVPASRVDLEKTLQIKEVKQLTRQASQRGLFPGDDPVFDRWRAEARVAAGRGDGEGALQRLRQLVEDFAIDRQFVNRKLKRLSLALARAKPGPKRSASFNRSWLDIQHLINQERLVQASREISHLLARLRRA